MPCSWFMVSIWQIYQFKMNIISEACVQNKSDFINQRYVVASNNLIEHTPLM